MGIAKDNITTRLLWIPQKSFQRFKLVWEVNLSPKKSRDNWRIMVDATKGDVVKKENYTVYDNPGKLKGRLQKSAIERLGRPPKKIMSIKPLL